MHSYQEITEIWCSCKCDSVGFIHPLFTVGYFACVFIIQITVNELEKLTDVVLKTSVL